MNYLLYIFYFRDVTKLTNISFSLYIQGGPCGVLAVLTAEILRMILFHSPKYLPFESRNANNNVGTAKDIKSTSLFVRNLGGDLSQMKECLSVAMSRILVRISLLRSAKKLDSNTDGSFNINNIEIKKLAEDLSISIALPGCEQKGYTELNRNAIDLLPISDITGNSSSDAVMVKSHKISFSSVVLENQQKHVHSLNDIELELEKQAFSYINNNIDYFLAPGGVLLFVLSLIITRGGSQMVKEDMDDPCSHLTSQFGHCSQELLNLLLTGESTSNVFDHVVNIDNALICRGVSDQSTIGYLTQLESLRYCSVGTFYKTPKVPIWVIGSQSHFTVLFSSSTNILLSTESTIILEKCRRVFGSVDNANENGFIQKTSLENVLEKLSLMDTVGGKDGAAYLSGVLEVSEAGIILWDTFWKVVSRLLTGSSLETVLNDSTGASNGIGSGAAASSGTVGGGMMDSTVAAAYNTDPNNCFKSDEEYAKELSVQFGAMDGNNITPPINNQTKSDEELARELQAQWDAEMSNNNNTNTTSVSSIVPYAGNNDDDEDFDDIPPLVSVPQDSPYAPSEYLPTPMEVDSKLPAVNIQGSEGTSSTAATAATANYNNTDNTESEKNSFHDSKPVFQETKHTMEFEKYGETFILHHYNGLRGGVLTSFQITQLSAEEAVGASVALNVHKSDIYRATGSDTHPHQNRDGWNKNSGGLEEVVRTRWPSCTFNWCESENGGGKASVSLID